MIDVDIFSRIVPVPESGCWIWAGGEGDKYASITYKQIRYAAHRVSYEKYIGPIPKGLFVLHTCDIKCCVNPNHLYLGTHTDNRRDAVNRGRIPKRYKGAMITKVIQILNSEGIL